MPSKRVWELKHILNGFVRLFNAEDSHQLVLQEHYSRLGEVDGHKQLPLTSIFTMFVFQDQKFLSLDDGKNGGFLYCVKVRNCRVLHEIGDGSHDWPTVGPMVLWSLQDMASHDLQLFYHTYITYCYCI